MNWLKPWIVALVAVLLIFGGLLYLKLHSAIVSRVILPESALSIIVVEDFKHLYSVQLLDGGRRLSDELLGPRYSEKCPPAHISKSGSVVTVAWGASDPKHFVVVDIDHKKIIATSNASRKQQ